MLTINVKRSSYFDIENENTNILENTRKYENTFLAKRMSEGTKILVKPAYSAHSLDKAVPNKTLKFGKTVASTKSG